MTTQNFFFQNRVNYGQQGHHLFCGGRGQIAAAFGEKISLENLEQQMLARQQKRTHFWRLPKEEKS